MLEVKKIDIRHGETPHVDISGPRDKSERPARLRIDIWIENQAISAALPESLKITLKVSRKCQS